MLCSSWAMPTASVGAPPARLRMLFSPMSFAVCSNCSGVTTNPHWLIVVAASCTVLPMMALGEFIAKYTPGCR